MLAAWGDCGDGWCRRFVEQSVSHVRHRLHILQVGGHDGVGHLRRQFFQKQALKQCSFSLVRRQHGSHVLQKLGRAAITEARTVEECVTHLPFCFAKIFAKVGFESFVSVCVFEVDVEE
jgi:hypothetical protein